MLQLLEFSESARSRLTAGSCVVALALAACGGGGGYGGSSPMPPPTSNFKATPTSIVLGQSAQLSWSASGGTGCTAGGAWTGAEPATGSSMVTPTGAGVLTYTLTCSGGAYGGGSMQSATLTVTAPSGFATTLLVADTAGVGAKAVDTKLVNPWGVAIGPAFSWVANNHTETSTLYDGNGKPQPAAVPTGPPLVVSFAASPALVNFDPTGIVYNATADFVVSSAGKSGAALFIFTGEGGMIAGWSPGVDPSHAITMYTDGATVDAAVYKGLALANNGTGNFLYAADFHNRRVDVFDATFKKQATSATSFTFADPTLPAGYAPFGIQALKTGASGAAQIYVAYAQQTPPANHHNTDGPGLGLVDVFDTNGKFLSHLIPTGGRLNAPWGLALAPADFGTLSKALLVGNFGDGKINGYDPATGAYVGTVTDAGGIAFAVPGLWGIAFGNDADNQPHNTLFYAAGTNNEANGAYGRIDLGGAPTLNAPPVVTVSAPPAGTASGTVTVTATVQPTADSIAIATVELFAGAVSLGKPTTAPYSASWDTTKVANGNVALTAIATDVDGNVGTSPTVTVTVSNGAAATTLSQIQASVFTPICSGCHTGVGTTLPGVQDLTAGHSFASLVGVASLEQPALMRVKPGDAANSYIIQKLEGAPGIGGQRMPLGGPFLSQATIDQIKSWIASGAPNN